MKKILSILMLLIVAIGTSWADETLFSMQIVAPSGGSEVSTDATTAGDTPTEYSLASYATFSVTGTNAVFFKTKKQSGTAAKYICKPKDNNWCFGIVAGGDKVGYKITLAKTIAVGDIINFVVFPNSTSKATGLLFNTQVSTSGVGASETFSETKVDEELSYTVKEGDNIVGSTTLYMTRADGTSTYFKNITITRPESGPVDPEFTLSANEVEVGKTISVNGPVGLEFTATPVGETTGAVSVSSSTITGVTAGAARVRVTSAATSEYNAYDHTFDITVTAAKIATELSFGTPTTTVARGEEVTNAATLTAGGSPIEGTITYSSADETIATVDATGKVTGIKTGTTSIKANYAGDATYSAAEEVSYDITVTLPALTPVSDTKWTSASLMTAAGGAKDYTSADVLDNLEIAGTSTALRITTGGNKTIDGETFGGRVRFGKDGSADGNYVHFKVTPNSQITMWGIRATAGAEENGLALSFGAFGENEITYSFEGGDVEFINYNYTGSEDIDVYAYSKASAGASMMEIKVAPIQSQTIPVGETGFATIGLPFATVIPDGVTAYAVTAVNEGKVTVSEPIVAGTEIPGNKGYIIVGNGNTNYEFTSIGTATASTNLLEAVGATPKAATTDAPIYVLTITDATKKKVGFKKATSGSLGAYKAYLPGTVSTQTSLSVSFDGDPTAVEAIAEANEANAEAPVKVIKNGKLFIGNYNVAGQQVK